MPLTVTVSGNRAYITGDGFAFTTAADGSRVNITGVGRTVAATFADPQADIQWTGGDNLLCSSYITGGQYIVHPIHLPYFSPMTLGDATTMNEVFRFGGGVNDVGMCNNYVFLLSSDDVIKVDVMLGNSVGSISPGLSMSAFSVINENIVYCKAQGTEKLQLLKMDFSDSSWSVVHEWDYTDTYAGQSIDYGGCMWMILAIYNDKKYLISADFWDGADNRDVTQTMVFDVGSDTLIDDPYYYISSGGYESNISATYGVTNPALYQDKVAFTWFADTYDPDETAAPYMTILVNMETDTVIKIPGIWFENTYGTAASYGSGCNQNTGIYYVSIADSDDFLFDIKSLNLNLSNPSHQTHSSNWTNAIEIIQGDILCYAAERVDFPENQYIRGPLPSTAILAGVRWFYANFVDTPENVVWVQGGNNLPDEVNILRGHSLGGGGVRTITLNFNGNAYIYLYRQGYYPLMAFNNTFVCWVTSESALLPPVYRQNDVIIFTP